MPEITESMNGEPGVPFNPAELNAPHNGRRRHSSISNFSGIGCGSINRCMIAVVVYTALLLDNILLTAIVPILPDYLANINNRSIYTPTNRTYRHIIGLANKNDFVFNPVYRYRVKASSTAHPPLQTMVAKHPIPGKSMINFSMLHSTDDRDSHYVETFEQKQQQKKQQYLTLNGNNNSTDVINIVPTKEFNSFSKSMSLQKGNLSTTSIAPSSKIITDASNNLADENGSIGLLLAMKAFVQLIFNPIVGNMSSKFGYQLPIIIGTAFLILSSLVFAIGETYMTLLLGRAVQGIGSACIGVCGMSLVAQHYPEEDRRSKVMGVILGSIALGVLIGYPFGGFLYDLSGKTMPFLILTTIIGISLVMQFLVIDLSVEPAVIVNTDKQNQKLKPLLESKIILAIIVAIWFSTSTMAILEPCLPIWLIQHLKPTKWQLGAVFIPDSVGYFVGTNFFGSIAYKYGQVKISCLSLLLVGISALMIPSATSVAQLLIPHFCLGLGIGIIDAALVPLLATFVDATLAQEEPTDLDCNEGSGANYGTVYCLQQTSVSLAYCLAPLIGGELAEVFGFTWLMRIFGLFNIVYGPILVYLYKKYDPKILRERHNEMLLLNNSERSGSQYRQLYNSIDGDK